MATTKMRDSDFKRQYAMAKKRGEEAMKREPQARAVCYDRETNRVVVDLKNGATFIFPCKLVQGLRDASRQDIEQVKLGPRGSALYWDNIGVDFSLASLMAGIFGTRAWMSEIAREKRPQRRTRQVDSKGCGSSNQWCPGRAAAEEQNCIAVVLM